MRYFKLLTLVLVCFGSIFSLNSCFEVFTDKIHVEVQKGSQNNYYEIEIMTNKNATESYRNGSSFEFSLSDPSNVLLDKNSGKLEQGRATWTSYRSFSSGFYIVVVKIDTTGDERIGYGDIYGVKFIDLSLSNTVKFTDDPSEWSSIY